jgi:transposase
MNKKLQKAELDAALVKALVEDSHKSYLQLAREFGVSINYLTGIVQRNNLTRKRGRGSPAWKFKKQAV